MGHWSIVTEEDTITSAASKGRREGRLLTGPCHARGDSDRCFLEFNFAACGVSGSSSPVTSSGIDYSKAANWLALPASITHKVDVFYLSDTAYSKPTPGSPNIGPINAPSMIKGDKADFQRTATASRIRGQYLRPLLPPSGTRRYKRA